MATIRKRGDRWQAQVRCAGQTANRTFTSKGAAERWARATEQQLIDGEYCDPRLRPEHLISDLIRRFIDEVTPCRAPSSRAPERARLLALAMRLDGRAVSSLDAVGRLAFFRQRLEQDGVSAATVVKELQLMSDVWRSAETLWQLPMPPLPFPIVRDAMTRLRLLVGADRRRTGTIADHTLLRARQLAPKRRSLALYALLFADQTGMRRGELCAMTANRIDWDARIYRLSRDKSDWRLADGDSRMGRRIPLSRRARAILRLVLYLRNIDRHSDMPVWPWRDPHSLTTAIRRLRGALQDPDLILHNARHGFCSREADRGRDARLVASAVGHSDPRILMRYTHPDMGRYADALSQSEQAERRR